MIMKDTIEETLYERNKRQQAASLSLNVTDEASCNQYGVQVLTLKS